MGYSAHRFRLPGNRASARNIARRGYDRSLAAHPQRRLSVRSRGAGHIAWKLLVAVVYLIAGIYFLMHPLLGLASFTLALAFFFVAEGVMDLIAYFQNRSAEGAGWILFDGIITLILGILVWRHWPSSSGWVIGTLVGISLLMTGTTRLMLSLAARRIRGVAEKGRIIGKVA
jgi:uncharacterized membrane protein HdeD (DUF308 family)